MKSRQVADYSLSVRNSCRFSKLFSPGVPPLNAHTNFRMPTPFHRHRGGHRPRRRSDGVLAGAGSAHATADHGRASAVVLRTGLDVSLLDKTVNVPLAVSLNEVRAPQSAERTALTARLDGVDGGQPVQRVLRADVASAKATVSASGAEASTNLTHARIHVPGLPLLSLIEVGQVTSKATCEAGRKPVASATLLGGVTVLGKKVTLTVGGPTEVKVPGSVRSGSTSPRRGPRPVRRPRPRSNSMSPSTR